MDAEEVGVPANFVVPAHVSGMRAQGRLSGLTVRLVDFSERYSGFNLNNLVQWRFQVQERTLNLKQGLGMGQGLTHTQQQT